MIEKTQIMEPTELRAYIEFLRMELIETGHRLGLNHQKTLQASEELDHYINEYQKIRLKSTLR